VPRLVREWFADAFARHLEDEVRKSLELKVVAGDKE
jgi:hypothetical protein